MKTKYINDNVEGLVFYWPPIFDGLIFLPAYTVCFSKLPNSCQLAVRMSPASTVCIHLDCSYAARHLCSYD